LVKGAAGQAVQVMNLMFQLAETNGLDGIALAP
jgi:N-acetyl-gamma-glutamyl-phosphate reductase